MRPFTFHASTVVTIALLSACMSGDVRLLQDDWRSEERLRRMDIVVEELNGSDWVIDPDRVNVVQVVEEVRHHCYVVLGRRLHSVDVGIHGVVARSFVAHR